MSSTGGLAGDAVALARALADLDAEQLAELAEGAAEALRDPAENQAGLAAVVRGARQLAEVARVVEVAAAGEARRGGMTVRELALVAGITERAATTRYPRPDDAPPAK